MTKCGVKPSHAAQWAFSFGYLSGVATLLSDSPAGLLRAVWPRESVDWIGIAVLLLTAVAVWQRPAMATSRTTWLLGALMGIAIVCRLLYGSIYLRPAGTPIQSLVLIALSGTAIGLGWASQLGRNAPAARSEFVVDSLLTIALFVGSSATLGMSGSMKYGMIGMLLTAISCASLSVTRSWPWVSNVTILMLLGLGSAFAELPTGTLLGLGGAILIHGALGRWQPQSPRRRAWGQAALLCVAASCVGFTAKQFSKDVKGDNASNGGYETYK